MLQVLEGFEAQGLVHFTKLVPLYVPLFAFPGLLPN